MKRRHGPKNPLDFLVLDEIYTFIGRKRDRWYVWTALGFSPSGEKLAWFHVDRSHGTDGLCTFLQDLPAARVFFSDENPAYLGWLGPRSCPGKGVNTNLVESLNSQVRQYVSRLRRKTKAYAKKLDPLLGSLAMAFIGKIMA